MTMRFKRVFLLFAALLLLPAGGCALRPEAGAGEPVPENAAASVPSEPTSPPVYTVTFYADGRAVGSETVAPGDVPAALPAPEGIRVLGWTDEAGAAADPLTVPVEADRAYHAVTGPLLNTDADWLFPDEHGFLLPQDPFTGADASKALYTLLTDAGAAAGLAGPFRAEPDAPLQLPQLRELLTALFAPAQVKEALESVFPTGEEPVDRARAAWCMEVLLDRGPQEERYFPDVSPDHWAYDQLTAASAPGTLDKAALMAETLDGFLWFDGYLYRLDQDGYFVVSQTVDNLSYGKNGRFTSGNEELDARVAEALLKLMEPGKTRQEHLRAVYLHVKNDFKYLVRNYYDSGATGWEIPEALTMYETGKGNCYNYAGMFWSLVRGLGYNAVTYSGTQGLQYTPHAWTEILLDGRWYICDPELEMNYWYVAAMTNDNSKYTDNYMIPREKSANWVYQAPGRD